MCCYMSTNMEGLSRSEHMLLSLLLLYLLSWVPPSHSFELHISSSDPGGQAANLTIPGTYGRSVIKSGSKGREEQTPSLIFFSSSETDVLLRSNSEYRNNCSQGHNQSSSFYIIKSQTNTAFTVSSLAHIRTKFPYHVIVHGVGCNAQQKRQLLLERLRRNPEDNVHQISIQLPKDPICFKAGVPLFALSHLIPSHFSSCRMLVTSPVDGLVFYSRSHDLHLAVERCLTHESQFKFNIKFVCPRHRWFHRQVVPFQLDFVGHTNEQNISIVGSPSGVQVMRAFNKGSRVLRRQKRQASQNHAPEFADIQITKYIRENEPAGTLVATVTATDVDSGPAAELTYRMEVVGDSRSMNMFTIDPNTGVVTTTIELDYEVMSQHDFAIIATDGALPESARLSATAYLTVIVEDVNDWAPTFTAASERISIPENRQPGHPEFIAVATDLDSGKNADIRYSILNPGPPNDAFMIDPSSGAVSTRWALDREKVPFYNITIQAMDQGDNLSERKSSTISLLVDVVDENDNKPVFSQQSYILDLREDRVPDPDHEILNVTATDRDEGDNAFISYSLNTPDPAFTIDEFTGQLFLIASLDYEIEDEHLLEVLAQDQGSPAEISRATVLVRVQDVNDNSPKFFESSYSRNVDENVAVGTSVLQVEADDADSGDNKRIEYSITDPPEGDTSDLPFNIDQATGWITTSRALDRELASGYTFAVLAKDAGQSPKSASVSVTISLRDVNDNPPSFQQESYEASISEEANKGELVVAVSAEDKDEGDNARLSYRITGGNTLDTFQIRTTNGEGLITVNSDLDARETSRYSLTVVATDVDGLSDSAVVTINVLDTNRFAPQFQRTYDFAFNVSEDVPVGSSVFKVYATDQDRGENARITYSISPQTEFRIDPDTGDIFTHAALNREAVPSYLLQVTAQDNGQPPLSAKATLVVTVKDVNDNDPQFTVTPEFGEPEYTGSIVENSIAKTEILQVSATDEDAGTYGQIRYAFAAGRDGDGAFSIDNQGVIRSTKPLDREVQAEYDLIALAIDSDPVNPRTASAVVHIDVEDVNDEPPTFASPEFSVLVEENSPVGTTVAQITATDPDEGLNARVEYSILEGADKAYFELAGRLGDPAIITTKTPLDYESGKTRYELTLKAESYPKFSTAKVIILVQDINDNRPRLEDFSIIFNNFKDAFPVGPFGRIPAYDPDVSDMDKLIYRILSGNEAGMLDLNETSGELSFDSALNSDVPRSGTFQMSVSDGVEEVTAVCRLQVRMVTSDMLRNAVTIRLDRMTQTAFLSGVMTFFLDALASTLDMPAPPEDNIFLIDVQEDTDVSPEDQILNVSVAVRKDSVLDRGKTVDIFFAPEYLREVIYLHRALLANLSTLQVLPFDDNLCLMEPCTNHEKCQSLVLEGEPREFVSSLYVMLRPIHPHRIVVCSCPHGFAGQNETKSCDTEIDLCYSFPCLNEGTCLSRESGYACVCVPGFTGHQCEYNLTATYDSLSCPADQCHGPSYCLPASSGGGFSCAGCPYSSSAGVGVPDPNRDLQCRLRTRSFNRGSYLTFPSLKARNRFSISLRIATQRTDGLLVYNGRLNGQHDFLALAVVSSQVRVVLNLGSNQTVSATTNVQGGVSTGEWTAVRVEYHSRVVTVMVGEDCDPGVEVNFADQLGQYACAVQVELALPEICMDMLEPCNRFLDLTGPLQVGGLPVLPDQSQMAEIFSGSALTTNQQFNNLDISFVGCISDVYVEHELLDFDAAMVEHLTTTGCEAKEERCLSSPCKMGGTCVEGWNTFLCVCPERTGGKDCSFSIEESRQLKGDGYLTYTELPQPSVYYPWFLAVAFRTRELRGTLMQVLLDSGDLSVQLSNGVIKLIYLSSTLNLDGFRVDDGQWHHLEINWQSQTLLGMILDYGVHTKQFNVTTSVAGRTVELMYVGASRQNDQPMENYFVGCVKDVILGGHDRSSLQNPKETSVVAGCSGDEVCDPNPCGAGQCVDNWNEHTCNCLPGTTGPLCLDICTHYSPCENWAECIPPSPGEDSYSCECGSRQSGQYCEHQSPLSCANGWWGKPVCGPCNCPVEKGFEEMCDKDDGTCFCKSLHYLPPGGETCLPCDCYELGSHNMTCQPQTGQCYCHEGVIGRRCDQCDNIYAAVLLAKRKINETAYEQVITCVVSYDDCPRNHAADIWWDQIAFGLEAEQDCPEGAIGNARRQCTLENSWLEPDLFDCTTDGFIKFEPQISNFEAGFVSAYSANSVVSDLQNISFTVSRIYGGDILLVYRLTKVLLEYEMQQSGLDMISQQYRDFVQKLLVVLSNVTDEQYIDYWAEVTQLTGGATHLMNMFEAYIAKIVESLPTTKSGTFEAVSDDMVLGSDWLELGNFSGATVPKYDNNVKKGSVDKEVSAYISPSLLLAVPSAVSATEGTTEGMLETETGVAYFGYVVYRDFGKHLTMQTDSSIRRTQRPMTVNSPVLSLVLNEHGPTSEPVVLNFRLLLPNNRTNLHCVRWRPSSDQMSGEWTASDCRVDATECRVSSESDHCEEYYVTCACTHLSTYAIIIDVADGTALLPPLVDMETVTYILVALSLLLLLLTFFILFTFKRLQCNWNSIRINIVFTIFIVDLAYVIGINRSSPELFCRLVAISLHYFYMSFFAWLFVEVMHLYRLMTEKQTINYGAMKFYYLLGYVIPGIIVGLAVGLYTEAYGNESFCWLSTSDSFIWSFAGPIAFAVVITIIFFVFAAQASCADKISVNDVSLMRYGLLTCMLAVFLVSGTWVLGLLYVNYRSKVVHYLHAVFTFIAACFIFLAYVVLSKKVCWCIKRFYYRLRGKKLEFDDNLARSGSITHSRSALAYRHDSPSTDGVNSVARGVTNVGISTTSTTSRSSNKSSLAKGEKYLQSTSSSASAGVGGRHLPHFESPFKEKPKHGMHGDGKGGSSDSDSDGGSSRHSLSLASSHSSDEEDDVDLQNWADQVPQSGTVALAIEQLEKIKKEKEMEQARLANNNALEELMDFADQQSSPGQHRNIHPTPVPNPPDVTLSALQQSGLSVIPSMRSDSLPEQHLYHTPHSPGGLSNSHRPGSSPPPQPPNPTGPPASTVQVLTHNGSISSDTESSETTV